MALGGIEVLLSIVISVALCAVGIFITYLILKAAVRNGTIEAYIKLRREDLYPPR